MTTVPAENSMNSYLALLSFAEGFRTSSPPDLKSCLQCLLAAVNLPIDIRSLLKTHLQIVKLLLSSTDNVLVAQSHVEKAVNFGLVVFAATGRLHNAATKSDFIMLIRFTSLSLSRSSGSFLKTYQAQMN